ncbi:hypothetical protein BASA81_006412 [Batrachochytrium salamandrivorans]|nr:hypothetical protein BASA81_006412 [Batrachochytrium salamandrivorans]
MQPSVANSVGYTPLFVRQGLGSNSKRCLRYCGLVLGLWLTYWLLKVTLYPKPDPCVVMERATPELETSLLPKIIHQQWMDNKPLPEKYQQWQDKIKLHFPKHAYMLWTDEKMLEMIETDYPDFLETYINFPRNIMRVDAARCFILHKFGGLYMDMDYEPLENFWLRLPDQRPAVIQSFNQYLELTQNSLMSSPQGHTFWKYTWQLMKDRAKAGFTDPISATGPKLIDQAMVEYERDFGPETVKTLPCENWQRVTYGQEAMIHTIWKMFANTVGLFKDCGNVDNHKCLLGIHHGTTMWYF